MPLRKIAYLLSFCLIVLCVKPSPYAFGFGGRLPESDRMIEVLSEASDIIKRNYYDKNLKNLDWKSAVEATKERIRQANSEGEMTAAISGLVTRLNDSHTYFLRPNRLLTVVYGFRAKAFGSDPRVYEIMKGGPAEDAGLQVGDKIIGVESFKADRSLIDSEIRYFTYIDPQQTITLTIVRHNESPKNIVVKAKLPSNSKEFSKIYQEYLEDQEDEFRQTKVVNMPNGVAYMKFPSFMVSTGFSGARAKEARNATALVLDLRNDSGGSEETMKNLIGHFISQPVTIGHVISREKEQDLIAKPKDPQLSMPLFVLIDSHSASASEIVARVLQLEKRATIIGDRSKGAVNRARVFYSVGGAVYMVPFGVAVTISKAVMKDGSELEGHGVIPDVFCVPTEDDLRLSRDPCLDIALRQAQEVATSTTK